MSAVDLVSVKELAAKAGLHHTGVGRWLKKYGYRVVPFQNGKDPRGHAVTRADAERFFRERALNGFRVPADVFTHEAASAKSGEPASVEASLARIEALLRELVALAREAKQ